jgi:hypothetical protein
MPSPRPRKNKKDKPNSKQQTPPAANNPSGKFQIAVAVPSLSGLDEKTADRILSEVKQNIYNSINDSELQGALDAWLKKNQSASKIEERDYHLLKSVITEYLDSYLLIGYNTIGDRILIQHAASAKDQDAIVEFLKNVFLSHQQQTQMKFLDEDDLDSET